MADARKDRRTLLSLKIRYKSASLEDFIERYSSDISAGGVFIKAKKPLAVGTLLKFEFILQDESTLIHGVGRVVWRREEAEATPQNPAGMGIKFIKMDPESRSVVQRIADDRGRPGVFEQGQNAGAFPEGADQLELADEEDQTKVRHVSEFLASALDEGGAGEVARREAQAGADRARNDLAHGQAVASHGAFSAKPDASPQHKSSVAEAQTRGAMSAFGGSTGSSGLTTAARLAGAAAPSLDEVDPEDDFLEDEATKIHDYPTESYPSDAAPTVVARGLDEVLAGQKRATPVVPATDDTRNNELQGDVPDLFGGNGADSYGPNPDEVIDASLLDGAKPDPAVPEAPGIPSEAFKVPQAPQPVWTTRPTPPKKARPGLLFMLFTALVLAGVSVAAWQFGLVDQLLALTGASNDEPTPRAVATKPAPVPAPAPEEPAAPVAPEEASAEVEAAAGDGPAQAAVAEAEPDEPNAASAAEPGMAKFQVVTKPAGAFVSVNGKRMGRTPVELEHEAGDKLSIYAKIRGYLGQRKQVEVAADQGPVELLLAPLPYVVQVVTVPEGATASAVAGGTTDTPGELSFRSMPRSKKIVVAKPGFETATTFVKRNSFTEETRRMFATVKVTLSEKGVVSAPEQESHTSQPSDVPGAEAAAAPEESGPEASSEPEVEPTAKAEEPAPAPVEAKPEPPAPSETAPADAP